MRREKTHSGISNKSTGSHLLIEQCVMFNLAMVFHLVYFTYEILLFSEQLYEEALPGTAKQDQLSHSRNNDHTGEIMNLTVNNAVKYSIHMFTNQTMLYSQLLRCLMMS